MLNSTLIYLLCLQSISSMPAPEDGPGTSKRYDFLIKGMDDQRQRLRTGAYRASGRLYNDDPALGKLDGPVTIFSAFDHETDKFRFDRLEPIREGKITAPGADPQAVWAPKFVGGKMIRLPDRTISKSNDSVMTRSGSMSPGDEANIKPFDVRAVGLFYWSSLSSIRSTTYPQMLEYYERERPEEVVEERRGIWRITWTFPEDTTMTLRRIVWLDQNSGYSPIRMELKYRSSSMPAGHWPAPMLESETTWVEHAGVWVPKTYRVVAKHSAPVIQGYDLSFDWEIVNGEVPARVFTIEGLSLPKNGMVVDNSLGKNIIIGSIGADHKVIDRTMTPPPPPAPPRRAWQGWTWLPYGFGTFGILVIGLAAWLRFRPSTPTSSMTRL